ncbi:MAG: D-alanyl-D-alanine carboxypeptidase/D-alanyl-D-alanine-endopeptidase [Bacteroidia bacterium]
MLKPEKLKNHFIGLALYDPDKQEFIHTYQAQKYFTPASNAKLFSFYTATQILGDSVPSFRYQMRGDSLIIKPLGDPTFLHSDFAQQSADSFLRNHTGPIFVDFSANAIIPWAPGWAWEDYYYPFAAERSLMPIYGNLATISLAASQNAATINPSNFDLKQTENANYQRVIRDRHSNQFYYPKRLIGTGWEVPIPFQTSEALTLRLLTDTLQKEVQFWQGKTIADSSTIFYSRPVDSLYQYLLLNSDNFFAEQILVMSAALRFDKVNSEAMIRYSLDSIFKSLPDQARWVDGAGLSRYNLASPRDLVWILDALYQDMDTSRLFSLFPAGGVSGTLEKYYPGKDGPYVYAKTGTLSNNHNLSGYIKTKRNKVLIFSLMQNHFAYSSSAVKPHIEALLQDIYEYY